MLDYSKDLPVLPTPPAPGTGLIFRPNGVALAEKSLTENMDLSPLAAISLERKPP